MKQSFFKREVDQRFYASQKDVEAGKNCEQATNNLIGFPPSYGLLPAGASHQTKRHEQERARDHFAFSRNLVADKCHSGTPLCTSQV